MKTLSVLCVSIALYFALILPFTSYLRSKPIIEQIGYIPQGSVLTLLAADQKQSLAAFLIVKVLVYFGSLVEMHQQNINIPTDYPGMSRILHAAAKLDPYNMDCYYFAQAVLVWDVGQIKLANDLLEYGMLYRTWDWYLPFFAGFNYSYFLKDNEKAAFYYQKAAELSGQELHVGLAGRFLYETGRTINAIAFLTAMEKTARNESVKRNMKIRIEALRAIHAVETALETYHKTSSNNITSVEELVRLGHLRSIPVDPYGGKFFIDEGGRVRTTSNLAFGGSRLQQ